MNTENFDLSKVCLSCLNFNRKMYHNDKITECLKWIAGFDIFDGVVIKVCWECLAHMNNILKFKSTVQHSYQILLECSKKNKLLNIQDPIWRSKQRFEIKSYELINIPPQYHELPVEANTKEEKHEKEVDLKCALLSEEVKTELPESHETDSEGSEAALENSEVLVPSANVTKAGKSNKSRSVGKLFICNYCEHEFHHRSKLITHIRVHTREKPFSCQLCSYKCIQKGSLKKHMLTHTGERPFSCKFCSYKCTESGNLKNHLRMHTGEKPFICQICGYRCSQSWNLKSHMRIHSGDKPFNCTFCTFKSKRKDNLTVHIRKHTGEKPFSCKLCSYTCAESKSLKYHIHSHSAEKPYSCTICSYKCSQSGRLKSHMRVHTGEKPFSCDVCSYSCTKSKALKNHMRMHTSQCTEKISDCQ